MSREQSTGYVINLHKDTLVPLRLGASILPGAPPRSQLLSWIKTGILNKATKRRVFLPRKLIGVNTWTSVEAYKWFIEQCNEETV